MTSGAIRDDTQFGVTAKCFLLLTSNTSDTRVVLVPNMADIDRADVLQGTLALMILRTLHSLGPLHGYGIARRIEQMSGDVLRLNQGTLYPALVKLEQQGWIRAKWGASDNNRRAKFYSLTPRGVRRLEHETSRWSRIASVVERFLKPVEDKS
jgi:transcriptional regulator